MKNILEIFKVILLSNKKTPFERMPKDIIRTVLFYFIQDNMDTYTALLFSIKLKMIHWVHYFSNVKTALGKDPISIKDKYRIMVKACKSDLYIVKYLVSMGYSINVNQVPLVEPIDVLTVFRNSPICSIGRSNDMGITSNIVKTDNPCLANAIKINHLELVHYLIQNGLIVEKTDFTPITLALKKGYIDIVNYLYNYGFMLKEYHKIFNYAVKNNVINTVKFLVLHNLIDVDKCSIKKCVKKCVKRGHLEILQFLIDQGIHLKDSLNNKNILRILFYSAIKHNRINIVKYFIAMNIPLYGNTDDVHLLDKNVLVLAKKGHIYMIEFLISIGYDLNHGYKKMSSRSDKIPYINMTKYLDSLKNLNMGTKLIMKTISYGHLHLLQYLMSIHKYNDINGLLKVAEKGKFAHIIKYLKLMIR